MRDPIHGLRTAAFAASHGASSIAAEEADTHEGLDFSRLRERDYNVFLVEWPEQALTIDELWPVSPEMDDAGIIRRRRRVDHWLENQDEFGTMIFAVTGCTHGSV